MALTLIGGGFAAYHFLPVNSILEQQLKSWLAEQGVVAEFSISTLTTRRISIDNVRFNDSDAMTLGNLTATYSAGGLRNGRVETIAINDLSVIITSTDDGFTADGLEDAYPKPENTTKEVATPPVLPFDELTVKNLRLTLNQPDSAPLTLNANLTLHGDYTGSMRIEEASIPVAGEEILITGLQLTRDTSDAPFALVLESIAHITAQKAWFTPLKAKGDFTLARDSSALTSTMTINDLRELWTLKLNGDAQFDAGTWNMNFEQPPMQFETGIIQPDMLFPVLRGEMTQTSGSFAMKGSISKSADLPMTSKATLMLDNMGTVVKDIPVNGVNGNLELSSLWPPATKGTQNIRVGEIVLGLPLKNGRMSFSLAQDGTTRFEPSTWEWAGGELRTAGASLNIYKPSLPDITLSAKGIALENLLSGLLQKGISATGTLSGNIPVHFTAEREAMIKNGQLNTSGGGVVKYAPDGESPLQKGSSFQTDILLSALENFHYEKLDMTINSKDAEVLEVLLHVKGRNPELYNGQIIELNINLSGNLLDIVQSGMNVYTLPERLQEQLMK